MAQAEDLLKKGEFLKSIEAFKKCLDDPGLNARERFEACASLGVLFWNIDQLKDSEDSLRRALQIASTSGLRSEAATAGAMIDIEERYRQANEVKLKGDFAASNGLYESAVNRARAIQSMAHEAKILRSWSSNYIGSSESAQKFLDLNSRAFELAAALNNRIEASRALLNLGLFYAMRSDYSRALSEFLRAWYYAKDQPESGDAVTCLSNIAGTYVSLGDYIRAQDYIAEALAVVGSKANPAFRSSLLINRGAILHSQARITRVPDYDVRALECFASSLELLGQSGNAALRLYALAETAAIYADQGRLEEAREILVASLQKARGLKDHSLLTMILVDLGNVHLLSGRLPEARACYAEALTVAKTGKSLLAMIRASFGLGRCAERAGDTGQAIASYGEAVRLTTAEGSSIVNDTDRAEFISMSREPFQALADLCYALSRDDPSGTFEREIFATAEKCHARSFIEQLERRSRPADSSSQEPDSGANGALAAERILLLRSLSTGSRTDAGRAAAQAKIKHIDDLLDAAVFEPHLQAGRASAPSSPASLSVIQNSALTGRTALLEYFLGEERSYVMCVTRDAFHVAVLPAAAMIADSLAGYLSFLEDPTIPPAKGLAAARLLYHELVSPVESFLPASIDHLVIVPDSALFRLPFETLAPPPNGPASPAALNDRFVVSYSPSASVLLLLQNKPKESYAKDLLAFGVPDYPRPGKGPAREDIKSATAVLDDVYQRNGFTLTSIPHARREVANLAGRVPSPRKDVFLGPAATEKALKSIDLRPYRLLHFACHAFSDDNYPLRSALVLSPEGKGEQDSYLEVSEMYRLRTNADLVVLSACQTGRGRVLKNEGVTGLPRVFFYMGARSVLSTLWPINDKAGARFMDFFYDAYFRGASKSEALRSAKQAMARAGYAHPYYWAAYILTGEF